MATSEDTHLERCRDYHRTPEAVAEMNAMKRELSGDRNPKLVADELIDRLRNCEQEAMDTPQGSVDATRGLMYLLWLRSNLPAIIARLERAERIEALARDVARSEWVRLAKRYPALDALDAALKEKP